MDTKLNFFIDEIFAQSFNKSSVTYKVEIFEKRKKEIKIVGGYTHVFILREGKKVDEKGIKDGVRKGLRSLLGQKQEKMPKEKFWEQDFGFYWTEGEGEGAKVWREKKTNIIMFFSTPTFLYRVTKLKISLVTSTISVII